VGVGLSQRLRLTSDSFGRAVALKSLGACGGEGEPPVHGRWVESVEARMTGPHQCLVVDGAIAGRCADHHRQVDGRDHLTGALGYVRHDMGEPGGPAPSASFLAYGWCLTPIATRPALILNGRMDLLANLLELASSATCTRWATAFPTSTASPSSATPLAAPISTGCRCGHGRYDPADERRRDNDCHLVQTAGPDVREIATPYDHE